MKVVFRGRFIAINGDPKKGDLKISDLGVYLKELKKEGQSEAEASRRKEMMKIRDKQKRINKKKICFFQKINKIDKSSCRLIKQKGTLLKFLKSGIKARHYN